MTHVLWTGEGARPSMPQLITATKLKDYFAGTTVFAEFMLSKRS